MTLCSSSLSPLQDFLGASQDHILDPAQVPAIQQSSNQTPPHSNQATPTLSMEEYFQMPKNPKDYDSQFVHIHTKQHCILHNNKQTHMYFTTHTGIGRPVEVASRVQKLKATVWLAEEFPLSMQEQIMPIIDLMVSCTSR